MEGTKTCTLKNPIIKIKDVDGRYDKLITIMENESFSENEKISAQYKLEHLILENNRCSKYNKNIMEIYKSKIYKFNFMKLNTLLNVDPPFDQDIYSNFACLVDAIITYYEDDRYGLKLWFDYIKKISDSDNIEGNVVTSKFVGGNNPMFLIKTPKHKNIDNLIHEAFIGITCLNNLKKYIPNFMYVYSYFKCPNMKIIENEIFSNCSEGDNVDQLIIEYIYPSCALYDLTDTFKDISDIDMLLIFVQVINAINLAHVKYGYTHYDLHGGNVLVKKYNEKLSITAYDSNLNEIGYINSNYIAYIIDFGNSRVNLDGISFGKLGLEEFNVDKYNSFPMYDIFRLTYAYYKYLSTDIYAYPLTTKLITDIFKTNNIDIIQYNQDKNLKNKSILRNKEFLNINIFDLIGHHYVNYLSNDVYLHVPSNNHMCKFLEIMNSEYIPHNFFEVNFVLKTIRNSKFTTENKEYNLKILFKDNEKFESNINKQIEDLISYTNTISNELKKLKFKNITDKKIDIDKHFNESKKYYICNEFLYYCKAWLDAAFKYQDMTKISLSKFPKFENLIISTKNLNNIISDIKQLKDNEINKISKGYIITDKKTRNIIQELHGIKIYGKK